MPKRSVPSQSQPSFWAHIHLQISPDRQREIAGLLLVTFGALTLLALFLPDSGFVFRLYSDLLRQFAGLGAFVIALALMVLGMAVLRRPENVFDEFPVAWDRIVASEVLFAALLGLLQLGVAADDRASLQLAGAGEAGGYLGYAVATLASRAMGPAVGALILIIVAVISLRFAFKLSGLSTWAADVLERFKPTPIPESPPTRRPRVSQPASQPAQPTQPVQPGSNSAPSKDTEKQPVRIGTSTRAPLFGLGRKGPASAPPPRYDPLLAVPRLKMMERKDQLPSLELLEMSSEAKYAQTTAEQRKHVIEETLEQFGIPAKVVEINAGPTITQFGVEPGFVERRSLDGQVRHRKVPVSRILSLSNDLALALAASPIRIEAPVPGRSVVGIEVPNEQIALVSLRGVMEAEPYKKLSIKSPLPIALGRDVSGAPAVADLGVMPHLLIAGATGSGKSVCINAVIACMLFGHSPDELRMIMVDPKRVELVNFNGIPHLLGSVITDVSEVVPALRWAAGLMDARFQAFSKIGARNIDAYNAKMDKSGGDRLPYLLIIIDELADLMLAAPEETEKLITRLAQMARATGIHLVLATQRPSVDVVTGLIKANFPARISFAVTSSVDSRVVLDSPGAEKLLGRGDMLYMAPDSAKLARLQGCFVSDDELARLTNHWRALQEEFDYIPDPPWKSKPRVEDGLSAQPGDELIERATELILQSGTASISMLQRKLGIGYPRAARLMDQLEERGVVGPDDGGGKPRAILAQANGKKRK